jgi:hypothetical protein
LDGKPVPDASGGIPQKTWIICAVAGGVLLLWGIWRVFDVVKELLSGHILIVN